MLHINFSSCVHEGIWALNPIVCHPAAQLPVFHPNTSLASAAANVGQDSRGQLLDLHRLFPTRQDAFCHEIIHFFRADEFYERTANSIFNLILRVAIPEPDESMDMGKVANRVLKLEPPPDVLDVPQWLFGARGNILHVNHGDLDPVPKQCHGRLLLQGLPNLIPPPLCPFSFAENLHNFVTVNPFLDTRQSKVQLLVCGVREEIGCLFLRHGCCQLVDCGTAVARVRVEEILVRATDSNPIAGSCHTPMKHNSHVLVTASKVHDLVEGKAKIPHIGAGSQRGIGNPGSHV